MTGTEIADSRVDSGRPSSSGGIRGPLSAIRAMIRRNLIHISRAPMQLSDVTVQPSCAHVSNPANAKLCLRYFGLLRLVKTSCAAENKLLEIIGV